MTRSFPVWTEDSVETLRGCFEATDWDAFFDSCTDLDMLNDTVTSYIMFCQDTVIKSKTVRIYPNNKPWISKDLKHCLNEKKAAFLKGDKQRVKELEREFYVKLKKSHIKI